MPLLLLLLLLLLLMMMMMRIQQLDKLIEVKPTALPRPHALDSATASVLGRATPHASPR